MVSSPQGCVSVCVFAGVLSGDKHGEYDFLRVCQWFASRADLIILLFDPYKLDIGDEFKRVRVMKQWQLRFCAFLLYSVGS